MRKVGPLLMLVFLSAAITATNADAVDPTWTTKTAMPTSRGFVGGGVIGGTIYVCGGYNATTELSVVEAYIPATDTWMTKASLPYPMRLEGGGTINGTLYVAGGWAHFASTIFYDSLLAYDPSTNTWSQKARMPVARGAHGTIAVNGKLYVIGGQDGELTPPSSSVFEYDPALDTWTQKADKPTPVSDFGLAASNGMIYAIGGICGPCATTMEVYDPAGNTWSTKEGLPGARCYVDAVAVNGHIFALGGGGSYLITALEYSPTENIWTAISDMLVPGGEKLAAVVNGRIYTTGGQNATGTYTTALQEGVLNRLTSSTTLSRVPLLSGESYSVTMVVSNGLPNAVNGLAATLTFPSGSGCITNLSGPFPTGPLSISAGGTTVFTWSFQVSGPGSIGYIASASGTEVVTLNSVTAADSYSQVGTGLCGGQTPPPPPTDSEAAIYVYPHPLKCPGGNAVFRMEKSGIAKLRIVNMRGQVVKDISREVSASPMAKLFIDCNDVKNGAYLLNGELAYADGTRQTLKPYKFVVAGNR